MTTESISLDVRMNQLHKLNAAVTSAMDDFFSLEAIAVHLRYLQLMENVLHPDDCCNWSADGSEPRMKYLAEVLSEQGLIERVDSKARKLMSEVHFARTTLQEVRSAESSWSGALATLESWTDAAADNNKKVKA